MPSNFGRRSQEIIESIPFDRIAEIYKFSLKYGIVDTIFHPLEFADTLIRLGYEPFPPIEKDSTSPLTGKNLALPSLTTYVYYLYLIDGASGLFRSVVPSVGEALINRHLGKYIEDKSPFPKERPEDEPSMCEEFTEGNLTHFLQTRLWRLVSSVVTIHVSYPLHVIAVRTMARFVTAETTAEGLRPSIKESWYDEIFRIRSFSELFAGCQARLLREVMFTLVSASVFLAAMKGIQYLRPDLNKAEKIENVVDYIGNSAGIMYSNPFKNVSDLMIINHTDIPLGNPPFIDRFETCWECIVGLRSDMFWKNSGSHFGRQYSGPMENLGGRYLPRDVMFGPYYHPDRRTGPPDYLQVYYDAWDRLGVPPAHNVRTLEDIFIKGSGSRSTGSIALTGVKSVMMDKQSLPFIPTSYTLLLGSSNPFRL